MTIGAGERLQLKPGQSTTRLRLRLTTCLSLSAASRARPARKKSVSSPSDVGSSCSEHDISCSHWSTRACGGWLEPLPPPVPLAAVELAAPSPDEPSEKGSVSEPAWSPGGAPVALGKRRRLTSKEVACLTMALVIARGNCERESGATHR